MTFPVTWVDVENVLELSMVKLKPVIAVAAMGETAMLPIIVELGTVEIPASAMMTKFSAVLRSTLVIIVGSELGKALGSELGAELGIILGSVLGKPLGTELGTALG